MLVSILLLQLSVCGLSGRSVGAAAARASRHGTAEVLLVLQDLLHWTEVQHGCCLMFWYCVRKTGNRIQHSK